MSLEVRLDSSGSHLDDLLNVVELAFLCLTRVLILAVSLCPQVEVAVVGLKTTLTTTQSLSRDLEKRSRLMKWALTSSRLA